MSSPSQTPNPSPTQSPSQSRTNHNGSPANQQPYSSSGGSAPSPSPTRSSSRAPSHPPTPTASQPPSRAPSLNPSPHSQHVSRASPQNATPPPSKSPSQSGLKPSSRNSSQTPPGHSSRSPSFSPVGSGSYIGSTSGIPTQITPYVPRFLREPPFFQPPTSPLPLCPTPQYEPHPSPQRPPPPESLYFPLLPPPPHYPNATCNFRTPPNLFTPPCSLTYKLPTEVLVGARPPVVPSVLPATFYTPFSRYYSQPRFYYRSLPRRRSGSYPAMQYESLNRSVRFLSK